MADFIWRGPNLRARFQSTNRFVGIQILQQAKRKGIADVYYAVCKRFRIVVRRYNLENSQDQYGLASHNAHSFVTYVSAADT